MSGPRALKKNEILFRENDASESMFVIKSGKIAITKSKGSSEIVLAELGPGDMLGEMAFFDNRPRSAGARAVVDTVIIELPFKALNAQFKTFPEWLKAIVRTVNNHLRNANQKIKQLEKTQEEESQFFPPHLINRLMAILGFVASHYGEHPSKPKGNSGASAIPQAVSSGSVSGAQLADDDGNGIEIPAGTLRRYTIQIFQQPTHKMQKLMEILQAFGYMTIEDMGEGRQKITLKNPKFVLGFVDFYNDYLFKDESKRTTIEEKELRVIKGLLFYGKKVLKDKDEKGKVRLNLTQIQADSIRDLGQILNVDDVNSLGEKKLTSEKMSGENNIFIMCEHDELERIYPYWELIHALKKVQIS